MRIPKLILTTLLASLPGFCSLQASTNIFIDQSSVVVTNPAPNRLDQFGKSVARLGRERFIIGAPQDRPEGTSTNLGRVFLYSTQGHMITNWFAPTDEAAQAFGEAVTAVGQHHIAAGAPNHDFSGNLAGIVYLFDTNGLLMSTITNPAPSPQGDKFGQSLLELSGSRFAISAPDTDGDRGAVYIADLSGNILQTITNPTRRIRTFFGSTIEAVDSDKIAIGATEGFGTVYIYALDGTPLMTITNPVARGSTRFGERFSVVGTNHYVVGAFGWEPLGESVGTGYGAVALYERNGTLVRFIESPVPERNGNFGQDVIGLGPSNFVASAPGQISPLFLYDLSGSLVGTVSNALGSSSGTSFGQVLNLGGTNILAVGSPLGRGLSLQDGYVTFFEVDIFLPDPFEPDDNEFQAAGVIFGPEEGHTFHEPADEDWVRFYALSNYTYGIDVSVVGSNASPIVDVYRELLGGVIVPVQTNIVQTKQGPIATANDFDLSNPPAGKYLVRMRNDDPNAFGTILTTRSR